MTISHRIVAELRADEADRRRITAPVYATPPLVSKEHLDLQPEESARRCAMWLKRWEDETELRQRIRAAQNNSAEAA